MFPFADQITAALAILVAATMICVQKMRCLLGERGSAGGYEPVFAGSREDDQLRGML
jgi:hypothetical protein